MSTPSGPEAWKRAWDLLEQAFDPNPNAIMANRSRERDRYIAAAQAYATLAVAVATQADRYLGPQRADGGHDIYVILNERIDRE